MPWKSEKSDQDAAIIESLVAYFATIQDSQPILLFCSENHSDFAVELPGTRSRDRMFALHPVLAKDLPATHYFTRLQEFLQLDRGYESLPELPDDEAIRQAIERVEELESETNFGFDDESGSYVKSMQDLHDLCNVRLVQQYASEVVPNLPDEIRIKREAIVNKIEKLLEQCRQCGSWDNRSELKLSQWMEHVPEALIPSTSLSNLLKIEQNLRQYLSVHQEMDRKVGGRRRNGEEMWEDTFD